MKSCDAAEKRSTVGLWVIGGDVCQVSAAAVAVRGPDKDGIRAMYRGSVCRGGGGWWWWWGGLNSPRHPGEARDNRGPQQALHPPA